MSSYLWPSEDGWPYPDQEGEQIDFSNELDDDIVSLRASPSRLFDTLDPLERQVISARFGLGGVPIRSMKQLHADLGLPREDLRQALGSGLDKLRTRLA